MEAGIPDKLFYKIGEVSRLAGVEAYILRYWESEFPALSPRKNRGGQRVYLQKDLDLVLRIKKMLHEEGFTIAGARKKLSEPAAGKNGGEAERPSNQDSGDREKLADALGRFKDEFSLQVAPHGAEMVKIGK